LHFVFPQLLSSVGAAGLPRYWTPARDWVLAATVEQEAMWGSAIAAMLASQHPTIRAINPRAWIKRTDYPAQEFFSSLRAFTAQRADLLAVLEPLPATEWQRGATVTGAGKPLELTVHSYANRLALHERPHLKQIERIAQLLRDQRP
ncbi:hypothetical protein SE17_26955, partial [Kouleothrix aurantiaca]